MRGWLLGAALAMLATGSAQAQSPGRLRELRAEAPSHLLPCPQGNRDCSSYGDFYVLVYPGAMTGEVRNQLQLAELLGDSPEPPIKRNLVDACAWAIVAATITAHDGPDGRTPSRASADAMTKRCTVRLPPTQSQIARTRAREIMGQINDNLRR